MSNNIIFVLMYHRHKLLDLILNTVNFFTEPICKRQKHPECKEAKNPSGNYTHFGTDYTFQILFSVRNQVYAIQFHMCRAIMDDLGDKKVVYFRNGYEYKQETSLKRQGNLFSTPGNIDHKMSATNGTPITVKRKRNLKCKGTMLHGFHETRWR
jgi:hypothetical protein